MTKSQLAGVSLAAVAALLDASTPKQVLAARVKAQTIEVGEEYCASLSNFKDRFLRHLCPAEPARFHREVETHLQGDTNTLLESWRGSAKSTLAVVSTIHGAIYNRFHSKLITSATGPSAMQRLTTVKSEFENNNGLRRSYGDLVGSTWNEDEIVLSNGVTIRAKGSGAQIRGDRYDAIDFDDSERDDKDSSDVRTADQRHKYEEWVNKVVFPTRLDHCRVRVLYTPLHKQSYWRKYATRIADKELPGWAYLRYPAIGSDGQSQWPSVFPLSRLDAIRAEIGTRAFNQEYMLVPTEDGESIFRNEWFHYFDETPPDTRWYAVMALDMAISKKDSADNTAIAVVLRALNGERKGQLFVPEVQVGKYTMRQLAVEVFELCRVYHPDVVGVPHKALEMAFKEYLVELAMTEHLPVPPLHDLDEDVDKVRRAKVIEPVMEQGHVFFKRQFCREAILEMQDFPNGDHDDAVDAVVHAITLQTKRVFPAGAESFESAVARRPGFMAAPRQVNGFMAVRGGRFMG